MAENMNATGGRYEARLRVWRAMLAICAVIMVTALATAVLLLVCLPSGVVDTALMFTLIVLSVVAAAFGAQATLACVTVCSKLNQAHRRDLRRRQAARRATEEVRRASGL